MSSSIRDEYRAVLKKHLPIGEVISKDGDHKKADLMEQIVNKEANAIIDKAVDDLLAINKRRVPKKIKIYKYYPVDNSPREESYSDGFNQCRAEVMRELT